MAPWRLEAASSGRFSIVLTGCEAKRKTFAQLTKIRLRSLTRGRRRRRAGQRLEGVHGLGKRRGAAHGRVQVRPTSYFPLGVEGRYVFLVAFGTGQTGTVSLRLAPPL